MIRIITILLFSLAASAQQTPDSAPRLDKWKVIGPGGGGAQFNPTICASDPKRVFVTSDMTGGFVSDNGGGAWRMFNLRGVPRFVVCDPRNADIAYVKTIGLWRTTDGARTWELVHPDPSNVKGILTVGDHAEQVLATFDGPGDSIQALAVDPADSGTLYAVINTASGRGVYVSRNSGKSWTRSGGLRPERTQPLGNHTVQIVVDPGSPREDRRLYVIGLNSVTVRERGEWRENAPPAGVGVFNNVAAGFADGGGPAIIYAVAGRTWSGGENKPASVWKSSDGGASWQRTDADLPSKAAGNTSQLQLRAVGTSFRHPEVAYVSFRGLAVGASPEQTLMGVAKTIDGGRTWSLVWRDSEVGTAPNVRDPWLNDRYGPGWGENPFQLAVGHDNPDLVFGTDFGRTMRTTDGGREWEGVYSRRLENGAFATTGLDLTTTYSVHFDPFDANRMLVGWTDIGLMLTEDGGTTWTSATRNGVPSEWVNTTYWVEFDPQVKGRVWAVMSGVHDLPRPKMWSHSNVSGYTGGVVTSTDGGRTWSVSSSGISEAAATHVLLDPASPAGNRTLYVCAFGKGVFKSTDNGKTWTLRNRGIDGAEPFAWQITRAPRGTLYLVVARRSSRGEIGDAGDGAIYRSTDGAETWQKLSLPGGCNGPTELVVDPKDERRIAISAWGRVARNGPDAGGGIFLSTDGGRSWRNTLTSDQHVGSISVDPRSNTWFANGFESSAYRSSDRGETWARIPGYNFKWGQRVVPDVRSPKMIFVTTYGGSVWYGPSTGDPRAVEDIVTPGLRYGASTGPAPKRERSRPRPPGRPEK